MSRVLLVEDDGEIRRALIRALSTLGHTVSSAPTAKLGESAAGLRYLAVRLTSRPDGGAILVVRDQGPGLPDPMLLGRGRSGAGSTGLGLDIVRRIATCAGGSVALDRAPDGGAMITVEVAGPLAMPARHG